MSFLKKLFFLKEVSSFSDSHGYVSAESRKSESFYRNRWSYDKVVRSTHGVNCTGSCSWNVYVKGGIITWETQATDYPKTRPDQPNHEPRGCPRGASYSWYLYSAQRVKYPLIRASLLKLWKEAKNTFTSPMDAWHSIVSGSKKEEYKKERGLGGFVRLNWDTANEIIAAANLYTAKTFGPDRIVGFSPIPAMSMISYAAGARYLSLMGGVCLSFYDWYCDLPVSSPQTWGEQTDVPESADWYNSGYIIMWGSNVPMTRTPDAHFMSEARYRGTKISVITPDFSEAAKFADNWLPVKQGTDAAFGLAMGHVILNEFFVKKQDAYFTEYTKQYSDFPFLVKLVEKDGKLVPDRLLKAEDFKDSLGSESNNEWKPVLYDEISKKIVIPNGTTGSRWDGSGKWNLDKKNLITGEDINPALSLKDSHDNLVEVLFPYFGGDTVEYFNKDTSIGNTIARKVPAKKVATVAGEIYVATVFDLTLSNYAVDNGLNDSAVAKSYDDDTPFTPKWQEKITGVRASDCIKVAREFAENASITKGKSLVIIGAAMNHWYHSDMQYRAVINLLIMCGCIGQSGGGWAHYVGQEKLRPQSGWVPVAFGLDWSRPPRQMNSTSFFYTHTNQWQYENLRPKDLLSPTYTNKEFEELSFIDFNLKSIRMGFLPTAPQLNMNPLEISQKAKAENLEAAAYVVRELKNKNLKFAAEEPEAAGNAPKNLFVWRSNLLGSSAKGHEYFLKYLLGTQHSVLNTTIKEQGLELPKYVKYEDSKAEGKLDLLVTLDFRMSTTCLYSDIVLPTATWYEKNDLNTSDMHPFIHPLSEALNPLYESKSDLDIYNGFAKKVSQLASNYLETATDVVLVPIQHDSPQENAQADIKDWALGEVEPMPGKTMPNIVVVERDYTKIHDKFTTLGPLLDKLGNNGKGITWNTESEIHHLKESHGESKANSRPMMETAIKVADTILTLAPETNGEVAYKSWEALEKSTGRHHTHLVSGRREERISFFDIQRQPRKIITSPIWSGVDSEEVNYTGYYTNVHENIPFRTLTGRQHIYQDHPWMLAFGEGFATYKPPVNVSTVENVKNRLGSDDYVVLNFGTPHSKWTIHSTYSDNLIMLTLSRGGPHIWISEADAKKINLQDNDFVEAVNANGVVTAKVVVSQRMPRGLAFMYHAQEKIINTPLSQITGNRGGIHNSLSKVLVKPTHMIGGYSHLSYGFNYYGTVGCNRDEFIAIKKLNKVEFE
ncbi:MAG: nitrate reductase subunit alpha [Alphaproteobacteria bacterium]|nr:nitrate reductase subunit alpha [Alphaproteobacteria bacterium]